MCGIAGIFSLSGEQPVSSRVLQAMNQAQFHRGPDEGDVWMSPGIGLAHRRLSIIDLSSGQQPMHSADGRVTVVYNGEIYNFKSVAALLTERGHQFRTHCDTEVILYAWLEWGPACVEHFRGMFAFAVYDSATGQLLLARDRLGIKPLHYALLEDGSVIFGSELKALLPHPGLSRRLREDAIADYFTLGYVPDPKTALQGVHKLPAGHTLLLQRGAAMPAPQAYWDIPCTPHGSGNGDLHEELRARLLEAVDIRLVAEVPLGAFLSGGVDSSAVVAAMAQRQADPVNTCAIGFDVPDFDETHYAAMVAERYRTNHSVDTVGSDDFGLLDTLAALYDEPFADASAIPTYRVCEAARRRVTVALSGDGGDELFAGYRRQRLHMQEERLRARLPHGLRRALFGAAGALYPQLDWLPQILRAKSTLQALARHSVDAYLGSVSISTADERQALFHGDLRQRLGGYSTGELFHEVASKAPSTHPLSLIQYLDMKTWLPGDILTKVDRASMAHSLEVRVPLLDHPFVEWGSGIDPALLIRGGQGKHVFKQALEPWLPHEVIYRSKMGFSTPLANWLRGPLKARMQTALTSGWLSSSGYFEPACLTRLAREHASGRRDHSRLIWALLMFEGSARHLLESPAA